MLAALSSVILQYLILVENHEQYGGRKNLCPFFPLKHLSSTTLRWPKRKRGHFTTRWKFCMGCRAAEQRKTGQTIKRLGRPNQRQPVCPGQPGREDGRRSGGPISRLSSASSFLEKPEPGKSLLRQEATERIAQPRAGERRKPEPARPRLPPVPRTGPQPRPGRLTFPSTSRHSPSATSRIL